jgi:competence protein ComFB
MEIHNISEDIVINSIQTIFDAIKKEGNPSGFCLCDQCRLDTICYALNRIEPRYIVSNRGLTRIEHDWAGRQQVEADIATLVYKGLRLVNHNQRPTAAHDVSISESKTTNEPSFFVPTIVGRLFDGKTFAPISGITVELRCNGEIVLMRNRNWQNPFTLVENTPGTFTFWPAPITAQEVGINRVFEYSLKIESSQYELMTHFFKVPSVSSIQPPVSDKTFKLPDIYLFPPGESEQNW